MKKIYGSVYCGLTFPDGYESESLIIMLGTSKRNHAYRLEQQCGNAQPKPQTRSRVWNWNGIFKLSKPVLCDVLFQVSPNMGTNWRVNTLMLELSGNIPLIIENLKWKHNLTKLKISSKLSYRSAIVSSFFILLKFFFSLYYHIE
jgi:hypothetical protein